MLPFVIVIFEGSVMSMTVEGATLKVVPLMEICCCGVEGGGIGVAGGGSGVEGGGSGGDVVLVIGVGGLSSISKSGRSFGVIMFVRVSGSGGARTRGASDGGGGACTRGAGDGGGTCARGAGDGVGVEGGYFGVVCGAEPTGVWLRWRWRFWLWLYVLCLPRVCSIMPRRFASLASRFPASLSRTCSGNCTAGSFMKAVFGAPLGQRDAFASGIISIAVLEIQEGSLQQYCWLTWLRMNKECL